MTEHSFKVTPVFAYPWTCTDLQFFFSTQFLPQFLWVWNFATLHLEISSTPKSFECENDTSIHESSRFVHQPANLWDASVTHQSMRVSRSVFLPKPFRCQCGKSIHEGSKVFASTKMRPIRFQRFLSNTWLNRPLTLAGSNLSTTSWCQYSSITSDHDITYIYISVNTSVCKYMRASIVKKTHSCIYIYIYIHMRISNLHMHVYGLFCNPSTTELFWNVFTVYQASTSNKL